MPGQHQGTVPKVTHRLQRSASRLGIKCSSAFLLSLLWGYGRDTQSCANACCWFFFGGGCFFHQCQVHTCGPDPLELCLAHVCPKGPLSTWG